MSDMRTEWAVSSEQYTKSMLGRWFRIEFVRNNREDAQRNADRINARPDDAHITGRDAYVVKREVTEWVRA